MQHITDYHLQVRVHSLPSVQPPADGTWWQALTRNPAYTNPCISRTRDWSWLSLVNENQEWPGTPCTNIIPQRATVTKMDKPLNEQQRISFAAEGPWRQYLYRKNIICSNVSATSWISKFALVHSRESPYSTQTHSSLECTWMKVEKTMS